MRKLMIVTTILAATAGTALSQSQNPPAQSGPNNPAVNTTGTNNANAPVSGANSFTEGQAKSRIEANGYTDVSELKKDDNGVWRGKAKKDGNSVDVSLDFQGNIVAR
jgi:protein-disulfide isomerase